MKKEDVSLVAKFQKLTEVIACLKSGRWTVKQLATRFDSSRVTIYRYLDTLEEIGFAVEKDFHDRYFIMQGDDVGAVELTDEEVKLLHNAMKAGEVNAKLEAVLHKVIRQSRRAAPADAAAPATVAIHIERLALALRDKHQVILKKYHSANTGRVLDRRVEPISFEQEQKTIIAFDIGDGVCKYFKIDRITEVEETHVPFKYEDKHERRMVDCFGFAGPVIDTVKVKLTMRAYLFMREEHPAALTWIKRARSGFMLHGPVASYFPIARFVLGLPNDAAAIGSQQFKAFLNAMRGVSAR